VLPSSARDNLCYHIQLAGIFVGELF